MRTEPRRARRSADHRTAVAILSALMAGTGLLVGAVPTPAAAASSWRCGSRLVGTGDAIGAVYTRCGEPDDRTTSTELVTFDVGCRATVTRVVTVEEWTYDRGPKQFVRYLTFRDGKLVDIDEGSYGE